MVQNLGSLKILLLLFCDFILGEIPEGIQELSRLAHHLLLSTPICKLLLVSDTLKDLDSSADQISVCGWCVE